MLEVMEPLARLLHVDVTTWWYWLATLVALVAAFYDVHQMRIPNRLTYPLMGIGLVGHALLPTGQGGWFALAGWGFGAIVLLPLFVPGGVGAGDVKLLAGLGSCLGLHDIVAVFLVFGGLAGVASMIRLGVSRRLPSKTVFTQRVEDLIGGSSERPKEGIFPMAPWMALAMGLLAAGSWWHG
jgi:prepilin peptidase CpaA